MLNEGISVEYSGDNRAFLSEIGEFQFMAYETAIAGLYKYYKDNVNDLDHNALKEDAYLDYAKKLRNKYYRNQNEK